MADTTLIDLEHDALSDEFNFAPKRLRLLQVDQIGLGKGGKGGKGGVYQITNAEFIAAAFPIIPQGAFVAACSKYGDPAQGGWLASRADQAVGKLNSAANNFVGCSSYYPGDDESFKTQKTRFAAYHLHADRKA